MAKKATKKKASKKKTAKREFEGNLNPSEVLVKIGGQRVRPSAVAMVYDHVNDSVAIASVGPHAACCVVHGMSVDEVCGQLGLI